MVLWCSINLYNAKDIWWIDWWLGMLMTVIIGNKSCFAGLQLNQQNLPGFEILLFRINSREKKQSHPPCSFLTNGCPIKRWISSKWWSLSFLFLVCVWCFSFDAISRYSWASMLNLLNTVSPSFTAEIYEWQGLLNERLIQWHAAAVWSVETL